MVIQEDNHDYPAVRYRYKRTYFDPKRTPPPSREVALRGGDRPQGSPYAYDEDMILAINVALAANRPLLIAGPPGTGKSALAEDIAKQLGNLDFDRKVITGRTEGRDLLWRFDTVRRLRDAHLAAAHPEESTSGDQLAAGNYLQRGVLWNAFLASTQRKRVVVLIDEIDKADPEVPNSLLEVLGNGQFHVDETDETVEVNDEFAPIIVITTNDERELSRPFRRRCVSLTLRAPSKDRLIEIAEVWGLASDDDRQTVERLAEKIEQLAGTSGTSGELTPNAAEYLDALRACLKLGVAVDSPEWQALEEVTLRKPLGADMGPP
jgi:MoxR-like ATPase